MAMVQFKKGLYSNLPAAKTAGTFYVTTDEKAIWLDVSDSQRIRLGDFRPVTNMEALNAIQTPSTEQLFYVEDINVLARWNGSEYIQINLDTGATSVEVVGEGNAVTSSSYDPTTRKLTLTKGETFATKGELDTLDAKVGTVPTGSADVISYINKKAEEVLEAAQGGSNETAASVKTALDNFEAEVQAAMGVNVSGEGEEQVVTLKPVSESIEEYVDGLELGTTYEKAGVAAGLDAALEEKLQGNIDKKLDAETFNGYKTTNDQAVAAAQAAADGAQAAADAAQGDVDALELKVGTVPADKTVVQMIADAQEAATYDDSDLQERVGAIEDDHLVGADKQELEGKIQANTDAIEILNGSGEGSVDKKITDAFNEFATDVTNDNVINSYKELIDWAAEHGGDAAEMAGAITALQNIVAGIGGEGEHATVVAHVEAAIKALKDGDIAAVIDRLDVLEPLVGSDAVSKQIKDYVDGLKLVEVYASKETYEAYVAANDEAVAAAHKAGTDAMVEAQKKLDKATFEIFEGTNAQAIADAQAAAIAEATRLDGVLKSELQGEINGKVAQGDYDDKIAEIEGEVAKKADAEATTQALANKVENSVFEQFKTDNTEAIRVAKEEAIEAATYDDTALAARVKVLEDTDHDFTSADNALKGQLIGASTDAATANTIYGAKAAATAAEANAKAHAEALLTWGEF